MESRYEDGTLRVTIRGPAGTPAVARLDRAGKKAASVNARTARGEALKVASREDGPTLFVRFPNDPGGAVLEIRWE